MKGYIWLITLTVFHGLVINCYGGLGSFLTELIPFHKGKEHKSVEKLAKNHTADIYGVEKNSTIKDPDSSSKNEHGKLDILFFRKLLGEVLEIISIVIIKPIKLIFGGAKDVVNAVLPETKGLDTNHTFCNGAIEDFKNKLSGIASGTKWCGPGNIAENQNDLGKNSGTDTCCKNHDLCPDNILAGKSKYGLKNTGLFTRSSCSCDGDFFNCLVKVNSSLSVATGNTYFNLLGPQCFELVNCSDSSVKCRKHKKHGTEYHWSDNPQF